MRVNKPRKNEKRYDFVVRCGKSLMNQVPLMHADEAAAVCELQWEKYGRGERRVKMNEPKVVEQDSPEPQRQAVVAGQYEELPPLTEEEKKNRPLSQLERMEAELNQP
jgi:hypothetical protein